MIGVLDAGAGAPADAEPRYCVASESCAFDIIGAEFVRDVEPGEMVTLGEDGLQSRQVVDRGARAAFCVFEYIYFARPDSRMNGQALQVARGRMGEILWREAPVEADLVIAVPDSGNPAARGLARATGLPQDDGFVKNRYVARTFIQPGQELRKHGLRLKFNPLPEVIAGKRLVVVDDSIVRGNTTRQIVQHAARRGRRRDPPAHLRAADQAPLPLRHRHVDARGDDRPRAHAPRRSPPSSAATRCTTSRWRASTRRSAPRARAPLRRVLHRRLPARRRSDGADGKYALEETHRPRRDACAAARVPAAQCLTSRATGRVVIAVVARASRGEAVATLRACSIGKCQQVDREDEHV